MCLGMNKEINGVEETALSCKSISINRYRKNKRIENHLLNTIAIIVAGKIHE